MMMNGGLAQAHAIENAARRIGAAPADLPGLWTAPGYPELTTAQMLDAARQSFTDTRAQS
jgi:hypothetical protein